MADIEIRKFKENEMEDALKLVWKVFLEYEAPDYTEEGIQEFKKTIDDKEWINQRDFYGAFYNNKIVGVIATKDLTHIALFFVDGAYHRQGIGRELYNKVKELVKGKKMTVNSSPYAHDVYKHFGFHDTDGEQCVCGLKFYPMELGIKIETERLILREYNLNDVDDVVEGLNNINVSKWLADVPYPYTREDAILFIKSSMNCKNTYNLAIVLKNENKVIGATQISNINYSHGTAGGGIWLNEKYQGKGYGSEAFGARIKYAFDTLGLRRLENGYFKGNEKSHKMQLKFGYKDEGIRRKRFLSKATKKYEDEYITGLLKEEWINK